MAVQFDPRATSVANGTYSLKNLKLKSDTGEKLSYTGADGQAFNLTINRSLDLNYSVYDRQTAGNRSTAAAGERPTAAAGADSEKLPISDPTLMRAIERFRQLVESQFFGKFSGRMQPPPPYADANAGQLTDHAELLKINESISVSMDKVDTEYWSVENTAGRLVDFAKSLYGGGDKEEHLQKMLDGIEQGFSQAKSAFGGYLPDISQKTVDLAKKMLTEWASDKPAAQPEIAVNLTA